MGKKKGPVYHNQPKVWVPAWLKKSMVAASALLLVAIAGGVGYTYYTDQNNPSKNLPTASAAPAPTEMTIMHPRHATNASVGVSVETISPLVTPNSEASISVRTTAGAACMIKVLYNKVPAHDPGLIPKTADDFGNASWTWLVSADTPVGLWPVTVTCALNGKSGVVQGNLAVTASASAALPATAGN